MEPIHIALIALILVLLCRKRRPLGEAFTTDKSSSCCSRYTYPTLACPDDPRPRYWPLDYKFGQTNYMDTYTQDTNPNTLFTAHPIKMICADSQDKKMKHARLNKQGGVMYISYNKPSESPTCKSTKCPVKVTFPYPPNRPDLLTCWSC